MTIYMIHGRPYLSVHNGFQMLSEYQYSDLLEHNEIERIVEVENVD